MHKAVQSGSNLNYGHDNYHDIDIGLLPIIILYRPTSDFERERKDRTNYSFFLFIWNHHRPFNWN